MVLAGNDEKSAVFYYPHTSNLRTKLLCIVGYYGDRFVAAGGVDDDVDDEDGSCQRDV